MSETKQACDCRDWSCGLPPCAECNEDHGGLEKSGRRLCRDCWKAEMMQDIADHEKANPGALEKRLKELAKIFGEKPRTDIDDGICTKCNLPAVFDTEAADPDGDGVCVRSKPYCTNKHGHVDWRASCLHATACATKAEADLASLRVDRDRLARRVEELEGEVERLTALWESDPTAAAFRARDEAIVAGRRAITRAEAAERERDALATRRDELLVTIRNLSASVPYEEENRTAATLIAEVGTLRAQLATVRAERDAMERERDAYAKRAREWQHNHDERMKERDFLGAARDALRAKLQAAEERADEAALRELAVVGRLAACERDIAAWLRREEFPDDDGTDTYKRAWNNCLRETERRLLNGAWRQKAGS